METKILPNSINWITYSFTKNQNRIFYSNAILFINKGTQNININDMFTLQPTESLSLECDQNEIDTTSYKFDFPVSGGVLIVWAKRNKGVALASELKLHKTGAKSKNKRTDEKAFDKNKAAKRRSTLKRKDEGL